MRLDWIVKTYKKNTYVDVTGDDSIDSDDKYMGMDYIRGKNIIYSLFMYYAVRLLDEYAADDEIREKCFGEFVTVDGEERGPFVEPSFLNAICEYFDKQVVLVERDGLGTIEEQNQELTEVLCMYENVMEFNEHSKDYVARIWAWY